MLFPSKGLKMNSRLVPVNASTSANATSVAGAGGNHRQKLDQIRSSLRPFEQKWYEEVEEDDEGTLDDEEEDEEEEEEDKDGKKAEMIRALVEAGYDQESAFYALKLVNFRSVMAAIQVLTSIKKNIVQQHTKNNNNNGRPSSGIPLFNSPSLPPNPNKFVAVNGAATSSSAWPSEPLSQVKSLPMEQQKSPLPFGKQQQFRPVHRAPTMVSPPPPRNVGGPSSGHALRQSQSFGPADLLLQQQQAKSSMGTVIRIERNQSERVERKERQNGEQEADDGLRMMPKGIKMPNSQKANPNVPSSPPPFLGSPQPVQRIFIDPQQAELELDSVQPPPNYSMFMGQLNKKMSATRLESVPSNSSGMPAAQSTNSQHNRSVSPLPESVAKRLKAGNYERVVKQCRAPMFRFFMEQHIEKLTQQYHERNKRARQLNHEMEAAGLAENVKENMLRLLRQKESKYLRMKRQKMNKEMFEMIRHIGIGAFGKVTLVRKWDTDQVYAMKTLVKADVIQKQQAAHVKAERDILAEANSPWIVKLFFSFQDAQNLYFIMEYVPGGDMMQLLINMGIFPESLAKFYIAELTLAVEYVHSLGFIHRDIKPDNILIDKGGHIKLTDFGLCTGLRWTHDKRNYVVYEENGNGQGLSHLREDSFSLPPGIDQRVKVLDMRHHRKRDRAHSVVGTGNYMAPDVIQRTGYNQATDWWSVGVILYEMVYGRPPFMSQRDDPAETQYMIVHWRRFLDLNNPMGARLSRPCVDCIAKLCCDQQNRMGQKAGAKDIKGHSWFRGVNFANLRQSTPEYIPRVRHPEDTSNFDTFEVRSDEQTKAPAENGRTNRIEEKQPGGMAPNFIDFTFRHFFSEGMGPQGGGGVRNQQPRLQRPSLAPLMETNEGGQKSVIQQKNTNVGPIQPKKIMQLAPPTAQQPNNPGDRSPLSARTILQIGGPIGAKKSEPFRFRPFQPRLEEEEMMEEPEESQC